MQAARTPEFRLRYPELALDPFARLDIDTVWQQLADKTARVADSVAGAPSPSKAPSHSQTQSGRRSWRVWALAFVAGGLTSLALAPFNIVPLLLVSFTVLVWQIDGAAAAVRPVRASAAIGWWFGFGYHLAGIHWLGFAFMVDADTFAWMIPFVAILMPGGLALFTAAVGALSRVLFNTVPGAARVIGFAVLWMVFEWLRGHILTGFPWNLTGYTWASVFPVAQSAALFGIYGLSLLTVLLAAGPAAIVKWHDGAFRPAVRGFLPMLIVAALLLGLGLWGEIRLVRATDQTVEGIRLRIVQPSIPQKEKWKPENRRAIFDEYIQLTRQEGFETVTHVIWPESALPFLIDRQPAALEIIGRTLAPGRVLLTGAARVEDAADGAGEQSFFNAVHMIDASGTIQKTYDKYHLVPFGEYLPVESVMNRLGLSQMAQSAGGFDPGPGPQVLAVPGAGKVMPLICYEAIFPGRISRAGLRPDWLLNVTNDAWFGVTTGPRQHFTQARFRAIEEGLPLVRSANTGISAVFDSYGRVTERLGLGKKGVVDGALPAALPPTLYARLGDAVFWLMMVVLAASVALSRALSPAQPSAAAITTE